MPRFVVDHQVTIERGWVVEAPDESTAIEALGVVARDGLEGLQAYPELPRDWEFTEIDDYFRVEDGPSDDRPDLVTDGRSSNGSGPMRYR